LVVTEVGGEEYFVAETEFEIIEEGVFDAGADSPLFAYGECECAVFCGYS
jgi:hypothetical protein